MNRSNLISKSILFVALIAIFFEGLGEYYVYTDYWLAQGKTKAFVTFKHLWRFYFCFVGVVNLLLIPIAFVKEEESRYVALALIASMIALIFPLFELWSFFIS